MIESYREFVMEAILVVVPTLILLTVTIGPMALIVLAVKHYKGRRK
jgi:hypothetical protein